MRSITEAASERCMSSACHYVWVVADLVFKDFALDHRMSVKSLFSSYPSSEHFDSKSGNSGRFQIFWMIINDNSIRFWSCRRIKILWGTIPGCSASQSRSLVSSAGADSNDADTEYTFEDVTAIEMMARQIVTNSVIASNFIAVCLSIK